MAVADWSTTAADNVSIGGIDIAEGCSPATLNNALREAMAQVKAFYDVTYRIGDNVIIIPDGDPDPTGLAENSIVIEHEVTP